MSALRIAPAASPRRTVVALHGRDQTPDYLVHHVVDLVGATDVEWLLPAAPGGSWYPERFDAPIERNLAALESAIDALLVQWAEVGDSPGDTVWLGFSQGACVAAELVARHPLGWGGLVSLAGGLLGPADTTLRVPTGWAAGLTAYFSVGDADDLTPVERVAQTAGAFYAAGARTTLAVLPDHGHHIAPRQVASVHALLGQASFSVR